MPRLGIGFCRATLGIKHLTARFQPQRFMIAPAAVGDSATCPRRPCLFVRRCRPKESKPASLASPSSRVLPLASAAFLLARNTRSLNFIEERQRFSFLVPLQADPRELQVGEVPVRGELEIMLPGDLRLFPIGVRHPIKTFPRQRERIRDPSERTAKRNCSAASGTRPILRYAPPNELAASPFFGSRRCAVRQCSTAASTFPFFQRNAARAFCAGTDCGWSRTSW